MVAWISRPSRQSTPCRTVSPDILPPRSKEETERDEKDMDERVRRCMLGESHLSWDDQRTVLTPSERWWRDMCPALEQAGYKLRPRYQPGWRPSWQGKSQGSDDCEDASAPMSMNHMIMDAVRIADNLPVILKRSRLSLNAYELDSTVGLLQWSAASDPDNHCMRIHGVVPVPNDPESIILVLPRLRAWDDPGFETIGEAVDFFRQIFEGVSFLHRRNMAHRDLHHLNIMMDARSMYPEGWHPIETDQGLGSRFTSKARHFSRTQRPPRYFIIDFGISNFYDRRGLVQDQIIRGGDRSCPEQQEGATHADPFPSDIYFLGNLIKEYFVENKYGFGFMGDLVNDMTRADPLTRPAIDEVVRRFRFIQSTLSQRTLRSRVINTKPLEWVTERPVGLFTYWWHRAGYALRHTPAVPRPC